MPIAALEVEIINKVSNIGAFAEEKAAMSGALGGVTNASVEKQLGQYMMGGPGSGAAIEKETAQANKAFRASETELKNATIAAGEAGSITDGLARKMNALGQLGITPATAALIGGVIVLSQFVSKMNEAATLSEANQAANSDLGQAYATLGEKVPMDKINQFIDANAKFLPGIAETKEAFASAARAGFDDSMQWRLVNDALDLAAAKHITLSDAMKVLIDAEHGRAMGLLDLGIAIKDITDPQKELAKATDDLAKAQDAKLNADRRLLEEEQRLKDKRNVTTNDLMTLQDLQAKDKTATDNLATAKQNLATATSVANDQGTKYGNVLAQVEGHTKDAAHSSTELEQAKKAENIQWQKFADTIGPLWVGAQSKAIEALTTVIGFEQLGADASIIMGDKIHAALIANAGHYGDWAASVVGYINDVIGALDSIPGVSIPKVQFSPSTPSGIGGAGAGALRGRGFVASPTVSSSGRSL